MKTFLTELSRRHVFRVAAAYAIVGWLVLQVVSVLDPILSLPDWVGAVVFTFLVIGFPLALVLTWAFELTPDGIGRSAPLSPENTGGGASRTDLGLGAAAAILILVTLWHPLATQEERPKPQTMEATPEEVAVTPLPEAPSTASDDPSIAVLAFVNMSGDPDNEYFSDGISEEILNSLAAIKSMRVAARTSAFSFKGRNEDVRRIGEALGVANVLEGSVRRAGDEVRVTAQLINVRTGYHLWSKAYDRKLTDIFAIQEEIAEAITDALKVELGLDQANALTEVGTNNVEAYNAYLHGRHDLVWEDVDRIRQAISYFREATRLDPDFAAAWGNLAIGLVATHWYDDFNVISREIEAASDHALALDPEQTEALGARAYLQIFRDWDWRAAGETYRRAMAGRVNDKVALSYVGQYLFSLGKYDEGFALYEKVLKRDPLNVGISMDKGTYGNILDRPEIGLEGWIETGRLTRNGLWARCGQAMAHAKMGRLEEAKEMLAGVELRDEPWEFFYCGTAIMAVGNREELEGILVRMEERLPDHPEYGYPWASLSIGAGQIDKPLDWFSTVGLKRRDVGLPALREGWLATDQMRADPRYHELLKKIRLDDASLAAMGLTWGEDPSKGQNANGGSRE